MLRRRLALALAIGVAALLFVAAYWWWSPQLVVRQMQRAGARGDLAPVSAHMDEAALRDNLRAQFARAMADKIGQPEDNALSSLGNSIGMAFVNALVEVMVRPQTIASALQTGRVRPGAAGLRAGEAPVEWQIEREGADRASFQPRRQDEAADPKAATLVFARRGFADWKLVEIRMQLER